MQKRENRGEWEHVRVFEGGLSRLPRLGFAAIRRRPRLHIGQPIAEACVDLSLSLNL
jgi:hypothetical protein